MLSLDIPFLSKRSLFFIPFIKTSIFTPKAALPLGTVAKVRACGLPPLGLTQCHGKRLPWSPRVCLVPRIGQAHKGHMNQACRRPMYQPGSDLLNYQWEGTSQ